MMDSKQTCLMFFLEGEIILLNTNQTCPLFQREIPSQIYKAILLYTHPWKDILGQKGS